MNNKKKHLYSVIILNTGSTSGIGKAVATECAKKGAKVILACRDKNKSEACVTQIRKKTNNENVHFILLDLSSLKTVTEFVDVCSKIYGPVDVLVNNAGMWIAVVFTSYLNLCTYKGIIHSHTLSV